MFYVYFLLLCPYPWQMFLFKPSALSCQDPMWFRVTAASQSWHVRYDHSVIFLLLFPKTTIQIPVLLKTNEFSNIIETLLTFNPFYHFLYHFYHKVIAFVFVVLCARINFLLYVFANYHCSRISFYSNYFAH